MKKKLAIVLVILSLIGLLAGCTDDYDAQDLQDAKSRYYSGSYTRKDETMVKGFNKWKANQNKYID